MREIKFRVFDKVNKRMNPHTTGFISQHGDFMTDLDPTGINMQGSRKIGTHRNNQYEFAGQFTGYTDKYGKDIFEGDIIQSSNRYELYVVIWEGSGWKCKSIKHQSRVTGIAGHVRLRAVIANIYENPKLVHDLI